MTRTAVGIGSVLGVGVAQAIALEREMANVLTISQQITGDNVSAFTDQIVALSTELPQTAEQLAQGLYQVVSTGFDGAEAMQILRVAAEGASAGLTTSETSARALLGVLKAYGLEAGDAADVMDVMFKTVDLGVISFEELAQQLGDVVPMAAAAGVEFDDLSSALAAITLAGIPAAESATALNMLMTRLMKPTGELRDAIHDLGYESAASAVEQDGLYVVVNKLNKAAGGTAEGLAVMWKDIRATRAALALGAADGDNYAATYAGIANEVQRAGATQKAYAIQTDTVAGQWQLARNQAAALGMDLGRALLPALKVVGESVNVYVSALNGLPGPAKEALGVTAALTVALLLLGAGATKVGGQINVFRTALAATRAGGALLPTVLAGTSLAVTGLTAILALGTAGYALYSASKQKATAATEDLVAALRSERQEGDSGAGVRKLAEQMSADTDKLHKAGVDTEDAIDAITSGGQKLAALRKEITASSYRPDGAGGYYQDPAATDALKVVDRQHDIWSKAVKKEADIAQQMDIVNAKVRASKQQMQGAFDLTQLLPADAKGAPQYTDEMKALAKAVGDAVDPSRAFKDAQSAAGEAMRKAGRDADDAKVSLTAYMGQLREQARAQRDFQRNLGELALSGYGDLVDHFADLGVDAAPMLQELVGQLKKGKTKIADELTGIVEEDVRRSTEAYKLGLEQLPAVAARYGDKTARAWARASETNDPASFKKITSQMALVDIGGVVKKTTDSARRQMDRGMALVAKAAQRGGKDAADQLGKALLSGDMTRVKDKLAAIWGADWPIEAPDLAPVVGAFHTAGQRAEGEWSSMLDLIAQVAKTKGSAAANALTSALLSGDMGAVRSMLDSIGYSVTKIPGSKTISIGVNAPRSVSIPVTFAYKNNAPGPWAKGLGQVRANGAIDLYEEGGVRRRNVAQIAKAGEWVVWGEEATGDESYIPLAPNKRPRSRAIAEETVRRLGGNIQWFADGGLSGWSYSPARPVLGGTGDPKSRVDKLVGDLRDAWSAYDEAVKELNRTKRGSKERRSAEKKVAAERADIAEINKKLGQSSYARPPKKFDLSNYIKQLNASVAATTKWRNNLTKIEKRAGADVAELLADLGEDGYSLVNRLATASTKTINDVAAKLKVLSGEVKATLADFTSQIKKATTGQGTFEKDLAKLAAWGYGSLAERLAEQDDDAARVLAHEAAGSKSKAATANKASTAADATVPADDLPDLLRIVGAIKSSSTGIHAVAEALVMDEDDVIRIANEGRSRITSSLGSRAKKFLSDLDRANKELSYADGGILTPGIYATSNGIVRFAEPQTQGEAFIPLGTSARASATPVLEDVARRFGYRLLPAGDLPPSQPVDARPGGPVQVVVIREQPAALVGSMPVTVTSSAERSTADEVGAAVMRRLRAAQRGGRI
ncbi:phage tail tape measure protein [Streptomyces sp. NPDC088925]|uniref:phage tail tape measure protein n=1 Tax=Streptomyces sp. NPDC088925 TaxID=3365914 RepID=UPI0038086048